MSRLIDLTGRKFGRLTVLERVPSDKKGHARWECLCDCGRKNTVLSTHLVRGMIQSCGNHKAENLTTHGESRTKLYGVWVSIKQRCENPNATGYENYGGRGIRVCDEWEKADIFLKWALENGYQDGLQIDRIENDGDYTPENCRWVTKKTNLNNKRQCVFIELNGKCHTIAEWARLTGIPYNTIANRLKSGKAPEEILKTK